MPIVKVPQKHKFGIVSLSRVEQLLALNNQQQESHNRPHGSNHQQITQAFVAKYNAKPENARESMDIEIKKALQHAKFRAGIVHSNAPSSSPTSPPPSAGKLLDATPYDTSIAWLELALLCQCNGPLQQEILLTLAVSLNHSPLSTAHVPSMVYIAGLCYQWLKSDEDSGDVLRTGELILLKVLFLISLRLYYHHLTGCLMDICTRDEVRQLKFDVEGFENKEQTYRFLPEALLHWKFALEVGLIVCEQYSKSIHNFNIKSASSRSSDPPKSDKATSSPQPHNNIRTNVSSPRSSSNASHGGSNISSVLWHSLDIWQCTKQKCEVLQEAIQDLLACSTDFSSEKWMEGMLAMNILCSTSQVNLEALNLVQSLAAGQHTHSRSTLQTNPSSRSTMDHADKKADLTFAGTRKLKAKSMPVKAAAEFLLPSQEDNSRKAPPSQSTVNKVATLNMLGMQPDFSVADVESVYTAVTSYQTLGESNRQNLVKAASANDIKLMQNEFPQLPRHTEASNYVPVLNSTMTASSVGTQSLIANESIPDALPSMEFSNVTMLDLGSITTLDPVESLGKSIGLFTSNTSKHHMDFSVSSPGLIPSGDLTSKEDLVTSPIPELSAPGLIPNGDLASKGDLVTSPIPELSVEQCSVASSSEAAKPPVPAATVFGLDPEKVKRVELNLDQLYDKHSSLETTDQADQDASNLVQPQHVKLGSAPSSRPDTRCTHYTHSTAPLAEGANMLGSQVHPSSTALRRSMFSTSSPSSSVSKRLTQFECWPGEVALTYTTCMASVTIYGKTSLIQRTALEGAASSVRVEGEDGRNFGLLELAKFESKEGKDMENNGFCDWHVRHGAILGLSRVTKTCRSLPMKDGLSEVAWSKLVERQTAERDARVLQAFNLAQVVPDLDEAMLSGESLPLFSPLLAHIADGLSELFLPAPPSSHCIVKPIEKLEPNSKTGKYLGVSYKKLNLGAIQSKVKADLDRPKPLARPSFNTRTFDALNKIAKEYCERQRLKKQQEEEKKLLQGGRPEIEDTDTESDIG